MGSHNSQSCLQSARYFGFRYIGSLNILELVYNTNALDLAKYVHCTGSFDISKSYNSTDHPEIMIEYCIVIFVLSFSLSLLGSTITCSLYDHNKRGEIG